MAIHASSAESGRVTLLNEMTREIAGGRQSHARCSDDGPVVLVAGDVLMTPPENGATMAPAFEPKQSITEFVEEPLVVEHPAGAGAGVGAGTSAGARARCAADVDLQSEAPEIPIPENAEPWGEAYLTNEEALRLLATRNSGVEPLYTRRGYRTAKRVFDVCATGAAIVVLAIPSAVLCAVICAKSPGASPIYTQWRIGRVNRDGSFQAFKMLKFRSMLPDADKMLAELQAKNEASGPMFKIREDPRVIPGVGTFIRKHSIDELPQLLNVFVGDMSLIGPRPGLPREVALYGERAIKRLQVKPGCGGPWQVSGRSDLGFDEMVTLDLAYIENRSIKQDIRFVFKTIGAMLSGEGAA